MKKVVAGLTRKAWCTLFLTMSGVGFNVIQAEESEHCEPRTHCSTPCQEKTITDAYFEGYLQGLVDRQYNECQIDVVVRGGCVFLANLPNVYEVRTSIIRNLQMVPGVKEVIVVSCKPPESPAITRVKRCQKLHTCGEGVWLPQENTLWRPILADPRQVMFYAAYRAGDKLIGHTCAAVAFGDDFPFYRWCNVGPYGGDVQISLEGGIWAVFNLNTASNDLVNGDYYVGIPVTYAFDRWAFRFRLYHISSHLGDEFLEDHPGYLRKNPAIEAFDIYGSYQLTESLRLYAGIGDYLVSDISFRLQPLYVLYGAEVRFPIYKDCYNRLIWQPFLGIFLENRECDHWRFIQSYVAGIELKNSSGCGKSARLSLEWYDGPSLEGQLNRFFTSYGQLKLAWGY